MLADWPGADQRGGRRGAEVFARREATQAERFAVDVLQRQLQLRPGLREGRVVAEGGAHHQHAGHARMRAQVARGQVQRGRLAPGRHVAAQHAAQRHDARPPVAVGGQARAVGDAAPAAPAASASSGTASQASQAQALARGARRLGCANTGRAGVAAGVRSWRCVPAAGDAHPVVLARDRAARRTTARSAAAARLPGRARMPDSAITPPGCDARGQRVGQRVERDREDVGDHHRIARRRFVLRAGTPAGARRRRCARRCRAWRCSACGSLSTPTARAAPSLSAASARMPEPQPKSSTRLAAQRRGQSSHARHSAVVGCVPEPKASPGSSVHDRGVARRRPPAVPGSRARSRCARPKRIGRYWSIHARSQSWSSTVRKLRAGQVEAAVPGLQRVQQQFRVGAGFEQREQGDLRPQRRLADARLEDRLLVVGVGGVEQRHRQRAEVLERGFQPRLVGGAAAQGQFQPGHGQSFGMRRVLLIISEPETGTTAPADAACSRRAAMAPPQTASPTRPCQAAKRHQADQQHAAGNRRALEILHLAGGIGGQRLGGDVVARQAADAAGDEIHQHQRIPEAVEPGAEADRRRRHAEADHVGERIQFAPERAVLLAPARDAAVEARRR